MAPTLRNFVRGELQFEDIPDQANPPTRLLDPYICSYGAFYFSGRSWPSQIDTITLPQGHSFQNQQTLSKEPCIVLFFTDIIGSTLRKQSFQKKGQSPPGRKLVLVSSCCLKVWRRYHLTRGVSNLSACLLPLIMTTQNVSLWFRLFNMLSHVFFFCTTKTELMFIYVCCSILTWSFALGSFLLAIFLTN